MKHFFKSLMALVLISVSGLLYAADTREIYLSRHAEKATESGRDPSLTAVGHKRAKYLSQLLKNKDISAVYSTDYKRTQQTAAPTAKLLGLKVQSYDPRDLKTFAEKIKQTKGNILIVGHSNTTPSMAFLLGGDAMGDIDEVEYDRLYRLTASKDKVITKIIRTAPRQIKAPLGKLDINSKKYFDGSLTFQMSMRGKVIGESIHYFSRQGGTFLLREKATVKDFGVDTDINVSVDGKTLAPKSMSMTGSMGEPADIRLSWKNGHLSGHSLMSRAAHKKQGKLSLNKPQAASIVQRSALMLMAHLVKLQDKQTLGVQWYNAYDDEITHIELSLQGEEKVTVPAGTFDTYKIRYQGGAPSQLFYVAKGDQPKVVKIEVLTTPFVYELVEYDIQ